jgi:hypothetical protein
VCHGFTSKVTGKIYYSDRTISVGLERISVRQHDRQPSSVNRSIRSFPLLPTLPLLLVVIPVVFVHLKCGPPAYFGLSGSAKVSVDARDPYPYLSFSSVEF